MVGRYQIVSYAPELRCTFIGGGGKTHSHWKVTMYREVLPSRPSFFRPFFSSRHPPFQALFQLQTSHFFLFFFFFLKAHTYPTIFWVPPPPGFHHLNPITSLFTGIIRSHSHLAFMPYIAYAIWYRVWKGLVKFGKNNMLEKTSFFNGMASHKTESYYYIGWPWQICHSLPTCTEHGIVLNDLMKSYTKDSCSISQNIVVVSVTTLMIKIIAWYLQFV